MTSYLTGVNVGPFFYFDLKTILHTGTTRHFHHMRDRKLARRDPKAREKNVGIIDSALSHALIRITHVPHVHVMNVVK